MKVWKKVRLGVETRQTVARPRTGRELRQLAADDRELRCPLEMFYSMLLCGMYCILLLCLPLKTLAKSPFFSSTS